MSSFTIKPTPLHLIKNGANLTTDVMKIFDLKDYNTPLVSLCHLEILTASYKLNGLNKSTLPKYDPDLATQSQILLEELNFQNHYNVETGHAIRLDLYSRDSSDDDWEIETSKLLYKTGLFLTSIDILYPDLVNTNVWICNPTTELGASITASSSVALNDDDFLFIKSGLVIKSDHEPLITYNHPTTYNVTTVPQLITVESNKRIMSVHAPITNTSSIFLRFGGTAGIGLGQYHIELPPGYNNPLFSIQTSQAFSVVSNAPSSLVIG